MPCSGPSIFTILLVLPTSLGPVSPSISQMGNQVQEGKQCTKGRRASTSRRWDFEPRPSLCLSPQHEDISFWRRGSASLLTSHVIPAKALHPFAVGLSSPFLCPFPAPPARTLGTGIRRDSGVPRVRSTFPSSIFQGLNEAAVTSSPVTYIELKPEAEKRLLLGTVTEKNMGNQPRQGTLVPCFVSKQTVPQSPSWPSSLPRRLQPP